MKKILVVEDDKNIAMAMTVRLKSAGYEVKTAYDAMTGLMAARKEQPDLMLLDISMPAGGGFSIAERAQNLSDTVGTPVIFVTASSETGLRERAEELGAVAFLQKPVESDQLLRCVRSALGEPVDG